MRLLPSGGKPFHQERRKQMIFRKRKQTLSPAGAASVPQTAPQQPYGELMRYTPLAPLEGRLYEMLREAVPIIDAAIVKLIRLTGGFTVSCTDGQAQRLLEEFLTNVPVGGCQKGIAAFLDTYFDQLLTFGTAAGEMVPLATGRMALYNAPLCALELRRGQSALQTTICRRGPSGEANTSPTPGTRASIRTQPARRAAQRQFHFEGASLYQQNPATNLPNNRP